MYVLHTEFARNPTPYIRVFNLLLKDLGKLFEFVEPCDANSSTYSARTLELLLRACVEVEANLKAILRENGYQPAVKGKHLNMRDHYVKVEQSHRLSSYAIEIPEWRGSKRIRRPFASWGAGHSLAWYQAYNATKHDREELFAVATLDNVVDAIAALGALLSAQFWTEDFSGRNALLLEGPSDGFETCIGGSLRVKFPDDWPEEQRYDFDWRELSQDPDPIQRFHYT